MNFKPLKCKACVLGSFADPICYVISCSPNTPSKLENLIKNQFVSEDAFLAITNGSSLADATKTLGSAVRHQFTVSESGHTWTLVRCFLHTGDEVSYRFYQLLFCDDALVRKIGWIPVDMEQVPYQGTTWSRIKPWDIEDMTRVRKAINATAVTPEQIRTDLKVARSTMEKSRGQGNVPGSVLRAFARASLPDAKKEIPINEGLRQRYDGCRASIGMSVREVDALYGAPLRMFSTTTGRQARVYGDHRDLGNVDHFLLFPYVAVVFDQAGHVANIYSDLFFNADWDPDMPSERRQ